MGVRRGQGGPGVDRRNPGGGRGGPRRFLKGRRGALEKVSFFLFGGWSCQWSNDTLMFLVFVWFCEAVSGHWIILLFVIF